MIRYITTDTLIKNKKSRIKITIGAVVFHLHVRSIIKGTLELKTTNRIWKINIPVDRLKNISNRFFLLFAISASSIYFFFSFIWNNILSIIQYTANQVHDNVVII